VAEPAFGGGSGGSESIKNRIISLMTSVRTLMRSKCFLSFWYGWGGGNELEERGGWKKIGGSERKNAKGGRRVV